MWWHRYRDGNTITNTTKQTKTKQPQTHKHDESDQSMVRHTRKKDVPPSLYFSTIRRSSGSGTGMLFNRRKLSLPRGDTSASSAYTSILQEQVPNKSPAQSAQGETTIDRARGKGATEQNPKHRPCAHKRTGRQTHVALLAVATLPRRISSASSCGEGRKKVPPQGWWNVISIVTETRGWSSHHKWEGRNHGERNITLTMRSSRPQVSPYDWTNNVNRRPNTVNKVPAASDP